jgi:hypothetical protein
MVLYSKQFLYKDIDLGYIHYPGGCVTDKFGGAVFDLLGISVIGHNELRNSQR